MPETKQRVRYELHHDQLEGTYEIRRVESFGVFESRAAAREHMIETTCERRRRDGSRAAAMLDEFHSHPNALNETNHPGLRRTLLEEEHAELIEALELGDLAKIARECADVLYVVYGTAWVFDINVDAALDEIHRAAMDKMRAGLRRADGKIMKPPGFMPPDMSAAVAGASALAAERAARAWTCPDCGASHSRGQFLSLGVHRCLSCGYVGEGGALASASAIERNGTAAS